MEVTEPLQVRLEVLGETRLCHGETQVQLSPARRRVLAALHLAAEHGLSTARLVAFVWPDGAPATASQSLANHLSWLRRRLPSGALVTRSGCHRLQRGRLLVDADVLTAAISAVRAGADHAALRPGQPPPTLPLLPYASLDGDDLELEIARTRLIEAVVELHEHRARAQLDRGELDAAAASFATLVELCPDRDRCWSGLVRTLARCGRRIEALAACRRAYRYYTDELGLDLPQELASLQASVLRGDGDPAPVPTSSNPARLRRGPLVGQLLRLLDRNRLVVLSGAIGAGKTTLIDHTADHLTASGHACYRISSVRNPWQPFAPVTQLATLLAPPEGSNVPASGRAGRSTEVPDLAELRAWHERLIAGCRRLAASQTALVLVVDDAHRAGPASLRLLLRTAEQVPQLRLLLVTRDEQLLPRDVRAAARTIALPPLSVDEVIELLRRRLSSPGQPWQPTPAWSRWAAELHADTAGHAGSVSLMLDALVGSMAPHPSSRRPPAAVPVDWHIVPEPLLQAVELQLRALSHRQQRVLDGLVVLGGRAGPEVLAAFTGDADCDEAERVELVRREPDGTIGFRSPLLLRAVARLVPAGRRAELAATLALAATSPSAAPSELVAAAALPVTPDLPLLAGVGD